MSNSENEVTQVTFDSVEEASKRWTEEGLKYITELNSWLKEGYSLGWENIDLETEPRETRHNMINYVIDYVVQANENNDFTSPRELFPPSHEPMISFKEEHGQAIFKVLLLDDMRIIARVGGYWNNTVVYEINNNHITKIDGLKAIGTCPNKKYFAKAYEDKIEITDEWDGDVVTTLEYPKFEDVIDDFDFEEYNEYNIANIEVFPDGKKLLLITDSGIFVISEDETKLIYPYGERFDELLEVCRGEEYFSFRLDMIHAAISIDGKYIALGYQDSAHIILNEDYEETGIVYPRSDYPHFALYHPKHKCFALNSCHFFDGGTVAVLIKDVDGIEADACTSDERLYYIEETSRIYAAVALEDTFLFGDANGYLRSKKGWEKTFWYCFVGSTICNMDISKDKKHVVVSTYGGVIHLLNLDSDEKDDFLITDTNVKEEKQWIFWKDYKPMVW